MFVIITRALCLEMKMCIFVSCVYTNVLSFSLFFPTPCTRSLHTRPPPFNGCIIKQLLLSLMARDDDERGLCCAVIVFQMTREMRRAEEEEGEKMTRRKENGG